MTTKVGMSNASPCGYVSVVLTSVAVAVLSAIEPTMMNANMVMNTAMPEKQATPRRQAIHLSPVQKRAAWMLCAS